MLFNREDQAGTSGEADLTSHRKIRRRGWRVKLLLLLLSAILCVVFSEVAARGFWSLHRGVPFRDPSRILYAYYPEIKKVDTERPSHGDEFYDILLLGGSVLTRDWGAVEQVLLEQLAYHGHHKVRIFNVAKPAQTSRDSQLKYAAMGDARFDLVIFYHGINEARLNNAPPDIFRDDYSHCFWYKVVNTLAPYHGTASFTLPYTLRYLATRLTYPFTKDGYVPTHKPRDEWLQYGRDARSEVCFERNLSAILDCATRRGDRVLLMTFATYVPEDYSLEAFKEKRLDYGLHSSAVDMWGSPKNVLETVAVHNEVVGNLVPQYEGVLFVDQASLMPANPRYFNDCCHFSVAGSSKFVDVLLGVLLPSLPTRQRN